MGRYDGPVTVEWGQSSLRQAADARCVIDSRFDVWQGQFTAYPPALGELWATVEVLTLRFPGGATATIHPAQIPSDVRPSSLGFIGDGSTPF